MDCVDFSLLFLLASQLLIHYIEEPFPKNLHLFLAMGLEKQYTVYHYIIPSENRKNKTLLFFCVEKSFFFTIISFALI